MLAARNARWVSFVTAFSTALASLSAIETQPAFGQTVKEETIVVRRGKRTHDVTISDDVAAQKQLWLTTRDQSFQSIAAYVETGKKYIRDPQLKLFAQSPPESALASFITAFETAGDDWAKRARAARILFHLGDNRGVDWAIEQLETTEDSEKWDQLRTLFYSWFDFERSQGLKPRRMKLTTGVRRYLKEALAEKSYSKHINPWIARLDGDGVQKVLRDFVERDEVTNGYMNLLSAYRTRFPNDAWGFEELCRIAKGGRSDRLDNLCRDPDSPFREKAIKVRQELILAGKVPARVCARVLNEGDCFSDSFLEKVQRKFKEQVAAADDPAKEWKNLPTAYLATLFLNTADEEVLEELDRRMAASNGQGETPRPSSALLLAIEMVSGKPMDQAAVEALGKAPMPLERMEAIFRVKNKSMDEVFAMFHQHGFAKDWTHEKIVQRLRLKERDGMASGYLPMPPGEFSKFEMIRETFRAEGSWDRVYYGSYDSNFWKLVDQTDGEFDPQFYTRTPDPTDPKKRRHLISFVWRGKRYRYPTSLHYPSLNVILKREGSLNSFAEVSTFPSGGFLTEGTYKIGFAPTKVWDALESDFGFGIHWR